jgi:deazaflavin-dependent oxidoreductase (nitroreductase family)
MNPLTKLFTKINVLLFQLTGGRLGSRMGKQSVLILDTIGRKSGKEYRTPLSYYRDGKNYLVVASNWGEESHPDWFLNLMQHPQTTIETRKKIISVKARQADQSEYSRLWELVTSQNPQYLHYQDGLARQIPIVILTP